MQGGEWRGETMLRGRRGTGSPMHLILLGISSAENEPERVAIAGIDTSGTSAIKASLQQAQVLLRAMLEHVPDSIYFKDLESRFIRVSAAKARKTGGREAHELIGQSDFDHFTLEHAQKAFDDEQRIIATGEPILDLEEKETWPDGRVTWASSSKLPLRDSHGRIIGTFGISRDITAHKLAEKEREEMGMRLQLAQKLESIGRLAAGIAHEVNTPTQYINDNTHFLIGVFAQFSRVFASYRALRDRAAAHADCKAELDAVMEAESQVELDYLLNEVPITLKQTIEGISRVARIVRSLKEFSHPNAPGKRPSDLNRAIETAITVSRHEWKYVAEVVTDLDPDLPSVPCVLDELNQVVLNLVVNAAHAIEDVVKHRPGEKGTITIRTRRDGDWALIDVADTGTGMAPDLRDRIFEPFFTTKESGKGTGQGLAIVQSIIVKGHGGTIDFKSEVGRGTTFHFKLPIYPASEAPDANASQQQQQPAPPVP
jgi:PAS domain S-box-containing protein